LSKYNALFELIVRWVSFDALLTAMISVMPLMEAALTSLEANIAYNEQIKPVDTCQYSAVSQLYFF
jgi:hypothetical protein